MKSIFLSDAHLKYENSTGYRNLLNFFDSLKEDLDNLFIVGDFFDFWFCRNDGIYPEFQVMIDKLLELKNRGTNIYLFEGNHDFFLDEFFGGHGICVFSDEAAVDLDKKKVFISHGDTIDTTNKTYLFLRGFLRSKVFYMIQKELPPALLWKIARISSKTSRDHLVRPPEGLIDKMKAFSMKKFSEGFDTVILGHCHQPIIEHYVINGKKKTFAVLGDWISHYSYVLYDNGDFMLTSYKS